MQAFWVSGESSCSQLIQHLLVHQLETPRFLIAIQNAIGAVVPMSATSLVSRFVHHRSVRRYVVRQRVVNGLVIRQCVLWFARDLVPRDHVRSARLFVALHGASQSAIQTVKADARIHSVLGSASQAHSANSRSVRWIALHQRYATLMETSMPHLTALYHKELMSWQGPLQTWTLPLFQCLGFRHRQQAFYQIQVQGQPLQHLQRHQLLPRVQHQLLLLLDQLLDRQMLPMALTPDCII